MKIKVEKSVTVITPTLGGAQLNKAIESVSSQTYKNVSHLIVADGHEAWLETVNNTCISNNNSRGPVLTVTPFNTGAGGFYGHRIYAAYAHLVNTDYVAFLDDDNWYDSDHIETLVDKLEKDSLMFAYSLRKVYIDSDTFLANDCCESIGKWPIWFASNQHLVDTSCYLFRRDFLIDTAHAWHYGWGGDRRYYNSVKQSKHDTTGRHTLNYVLPNMNEAYGGDREFFAKGNAIIKQRYGDYPWLINQT